MAIKSRPASIDAVSFECPYCGAFAHQNWYNVSAVSLPGKNRVPVRWTEEGRASVQDDNELDGDTKEKLLKIIDNSLSSFPYVMASEHSSHTPIGNISLSRCTSCQDFSLWVGDRVVYPPVLAVVPANGDMPADIASDFDEARSIVDASPRGAAALLRLAVQKLCAELGESGKNIDSDIASLVKKGLNPLLQQSLDIVRVIGNEAVHPGTVDLRDDRRTALVLFQIVNSIVEQMISHPKVINEMYAGLPAGKLKGIAARDK